MHDDRPIYCFVGGKSAGHILPALRLSHMRYQHEHAYTVYISACSSLDNTLVSQACHVDEHISYHVEGTSPFRWISGIQCVWACIVTLVRSLRLLQRTFPDTVIVTGGRISVPVAYAAWLLHIPVEVYELNARPGKAAYYISYIADITYVCFQSAASYFPNRAAVRTAAYPLSERMQTMCTQYQAREYLDISQRIFVVLVLGGSQGSQYINQIIQDMLEYVSVPNCLFVHQTGYQSVDHMRAAYYAHGVHAYVFSFRDDMAYVYQAADVCIARAGSGTLFEIVHAHLPAYIIPLETSSTQHQIYNAEAIANAYPQQFRVRRQIDASGYDVACFITRYYHASYPRAMHDRVSDMSDQHYQL